MKSKTMDRITEASPRVRARVAGVLYVITMAAGIFAEGFARSMLVVPGDAAATATNILASQPLYRFGLAADIVMLASYVAVTLLFYDLFKPVNKHLSLLAAFFSLLGVAVLALSCLNHLVPLAILGGEHYLAAFETDQLQAMAYTSIKLHTKGYNISVVFFGFYFLLIGYLIFRSTFLPRILGALLAIGGLCYLTNSFANLFSPPLANYLFPHILVPGLVAEVFLGLWLLVIGLNAPKWEQQASVMGNADRSRFRGSDGPAWN